MSSIGGRLLGAAAGVVVDRLAGEPPPAAHPVAWFGRLMTRLERRVWADARGPGVAYAAAGVAAGAGAGALLGRTALATSVAVAGRALGEEALGVAAALAGGDVDEARRRLPALAGRDPGALDEKGVARAVVESMAENTVDAVVAPACWAALLGAAGAGGYRALNTLDAMVGHRTARHVRFGWAAARLDDTANWVPARLTAVLVAAVRPAAAAEVARVLRRPPEHRSRNAAVSEGAFAAALGVRLGGDAAYGGRVEHRPSFGTGRPPEPADIAAAVRLSRDVTLALAAALTAAGLAARVTPPRRTPRRGVQTALMQRETNATSRRRGQGWRA